MLSASAHCSSCTQGHNINFGFVDGFSSSSFRSHRHLLPHNKRRSLGASVQFTVHDSLTAELQQSLSAAACCSSCVLSQNLNLGFALCFYSHSTHSSRLFLPRPEWWAVSDATEFTVQNSAAALLLEQLLPVVACWRCQFLPHVKRWGGARLISR